MHNAEMRLRVGFVFTIAACFLHSAPEGPFAGSTPLVVINDTAYSLTNVNFTAPEGGISSSWQLIKIEPGATMKFSVQPKPVVIELTAEGGGARWNIVTMKLDIAGPTELVISARGWTKPPPAGYTRLAAVPKGPNDGGGPAQSTPDDDPDDCSEHGYGCPAGQRCAPNSGPMRSDGYRPARCVPG
jgi:hypothetical protein